MSDSLLASRLKEIDNGHRNMARTSGTLWELIDRYPEYAWLAEYLQKITQKTPLRFMAELAGVESIKRNHSHNDERVFVEGATDFRGRVRVTCKKCGDFIGYKRAGDRERGAMFDDQHGLETDEQELDSEE